MTPLLSVDDLAVTYPDGTRALRGVSLQVGKGQIAGLVGESGSGKSTLAASLLGLCQADEISGTITTGGSTLPAHDLSGLAGLRWTRISMAFQHAQSGFDPLMPVIEQIEEPIAVHQPDQNARVRARELWHEVGLPTDRLGAFAHELSGGQARRAMVAMALACRPELVILDEPTAGLDAIQARQTIALLKDYAAQGAGLLVISHDLDELAGFADSISVLLDGLIVESGSDAQLLDDPAHPYTWSLIEAYPRMDRPRDLGAARADHLRTAGGPGCPYASRCPQVIPVCHTELPVLAPARDRELACHRGGMVTLLDAEQVSFSYGSSRVLDAADLSLRACETLAVIGPSGSGKTTLAHCLSGRLRPQSGNVRVNGNHEFPVVQLVAQDPVSAVSPRMSIETIVGEPMTITNSVPRAQRPAVVQELLARVGLPTDPEFLQRYPHQLSGGQLQQVVLARTIAADPKVIVADEPTAMLDSVEQSRLVRTLKDLQDATGVAILITSHDLALVRKIAHRVAVLDQGRIVEQGPTHEVLANPTHATTRELLAQASRTTNREENR